MSIYQHSAYTTNIVGTAAMPGLPKDMDSIYLRGEEILVSAGLFDGLTGMLLWSFGQAKPVHRGRRYDRRTWRRLNNMKRSLP